MKLSEQMFDASLPIAGIEVNVLEVVLLGFVVGYISGLFGVGGGFLLTPMLNIAFRIPYHIAVGSSLSQMVGTSFAGTLRHSQYRHVDYKLGLVILAGSTPGVEIGVDLLETLKSTETPVLNGLQIGTLDVCMSMIYLVLLILVATAVRKEVLQVWRENNTSIQPEPGELKILEIGRRFRQIFHIFHIRRRSVSQNHRLKVFRSGLSWGLE